MTGSIVLGVVGTASGVACALFLRELLRELQDRRVLVRAEGRVEQVEFSRAGHPTGSRATVTFADRHGQRRRLVTPWDEVPYSIGDRVPVGYSDGKKGAPRVLRIRELATTVIYTGLTGAFALAVAYVLIRSASASR